MSIRIWRGALNPAKELSDERGIEVRVPSADDDERFRLVRERSP
jgi:hypothetical protein